MLEENELLASMVQSGSSVVFAKQIGRALAVLPPDQYRLGLQFLNYVLGQCPPPLLSPTPPPPTLRSAHEPPSLY